ncbi:MAG: hypothetical protein ACPHK8_02175 [Thermoplasmatota archaeon]
MTRAIQVALAAIVLLAGCLGATTPKEPTGDHEPWTRSEADPWIVLSSGCGICGPSSQSVQQALVLYKSGEVMQFRYGVQATPEGEEPNHQVHLANFTTAIEKVVDFASLYAEENNTLLVTNITTAHLGEDKGKVHRVLETGLQFARDPGAPDLTGCADCAPSHFTSPEWDVQLWGSYEGTAWQDMLDQLQLVQAWIHEFPEHE